MTDIAVADLRQIEADARKFAAMFSGFIKACELFGRIETLEQAIGESQARVQRAKEEENQYFNTRNAEAQRIADQAGRAIAEERERAHAEALAIRTLAREQADQFVAEATYKAGEINRAADGIRDRINMQMAKLEALNDAVKQVSGDLDERRRELAQMTDNVESAKAQHRDVQAAHAAFLASIGAARK